MSRRTARGNRLGLAVVGAVLLVAGLAALARGLDLLPGLPGRSPVIGPAARDAADRAWFWPTVAALLILVTLLALRWLAVQTRADALRVLRLEADPGQGGTRLPARALTGAVQTDLAASPFLRRADASLGGSSAHPRLYLSADLAPDADPGAAVERIREAVDRSRQALERPRMPAVVQIRAAR